jgi:hypothetical protein
MRNRRSLALRSRISGKIAVSSDWKEAAFVIKHEVDGLVEQLPGRRTAEHANEIVERTQAIVA